MEGVRSQALSNPGVLVGLVLFFIGFLIFAFTAFSAVSSFGSFTGSGTFPDFSGTVCGWGIAAIGIFVMIISSFFARSSRVLPPPPPIQQPMVPAGTQGPVALNCPACGAPAENVDRFGVAVCPHCNTRFLVR